MTPEPRSPHRQAAGAAAGAATKERSPGFFRIRRASQTSGAPLRSSRAALRTRLGRGARPDIRFLTHPPQAILNLTFLTEPVLRVRSRGENDHKMRIAAATLVVSVVLFAAHARAAGVFVAAPIIGDADSGISTAKTYTHAVDFGAGG